MAASISSIDVSGQNIEDQVVIKCEKSCEINDKMNRIKEK